jgi:dienelactone hydrolase
MVEQFEIRSGRHRIKGLLTLPDRDGRFPCVILSHGLISSKDSSKYVAISEAFQASGVATCRFDYEGCGDSEGNIEETTLSGRVKNLDDVFEWTLKRPSLDSEKIGLLGSSFGGATSLIKAARDRRVLCICLWATPCLLEKKETSFSEIDFRNLLYEDFARHDLLAEARNVSCALVIHGEMDEMVPAREGKAVYRNLKKPKRFELIKGADHIFSVPGHRNRAITLSLDWFRRFLV